jgi:putative heme iron utilization protein
MSEGPRPAPEFDGIALAKELLRTTRAGALATLGRESGAPFASLVNVATDLDGSPILLLSRLAAHTLDLEADPRASILLAQIGKGDPLAHPRLTVIGRAERVAEPRIRRRFLARHPKSKLYADFADFSFWRLDFAQAHLNGGFARAMGLTGQELRTALTGAEELGEIEEGALEHLNGEHRDSLALYAMRAGAGPGEWRTSGLDPEGLDLVAGDRTARLGFPQRVATGAELRRVLKAVAHEARALTAKRGEGPEGT